MEDKCLYGSDPDLVPEDYIKLFKFYRKKNMADMKSGHFIDVKSRISKMLQLDGKMLGEMWARCRNNLGTDKFTIESTYTKITITDLKQLEKCARTLNDSNALRMFEGARAIQDAQRKIRGRGADK